MIFKTYPVRLPSTSGGPCWLCRRRDEGIGFPGSGRTPRIVWTCVEHIPLYRKATTVPRAEYDRYEQIALQEAGAVAGEYLDSIGKTDLATLDEAEWIIFLRKVIDTFGDDLAKRVAELEVPF